MNRTRWLLLLAVVALLAANFGYRLWRDRGLITIHADDRPLSEVIRTLEKKGGIRLRTNLDVSKPVTVHMRKVQLPMALELLGAATEARWQLAYVLAPDKAAVERAVGSFASGQKIEGWKSFRLDVPWGGSGFGDGEEPPADARRDRWEVKPAQPATLHGYLEQASRNVSARFDAPETWDPPVAGAVKPGPLSKVMPQLADASKGRVAEVFLLLGRPRDLAGGPGEPRPERDAAPRPERSEARMEERGAAMEERALAEIARLPEAERAKAQAEFAERKAMFAAFRDLSPEERRAKMEEMMSKPEAQDRMEKGMARREALKTPEQRADRYRTYLERKGSADR